MMNQLSQLQLPVNRAEGSFFMVGGRLSAPWLADNEKLKKALAETP